MKISSVTFPALTFLSIIMLFGLLSCGSSDQSNSNVDSLSKDSVVAAKPKQDTLLLIKGTNVNLRVSPDLEAVRIRQLKTNDTCVILEKGKQDTIDETTIDFWYKIRYKNKEGWVFGAFTSLKASEKPAANKNKTWIK